MQAGIPEVPGRAFGKGTIALAAFRAKYGEALQNAFPENMAGDYAGSLH
jgi:hypothetical protein